MCSPSPDDEEDRTAETESFKGTEESEQSERSELLYGIDDSPSWILSLLLGFQVSFVAKFGVDVDDAKCIVVTRVCVSVGGRMPSAYTIARTRM